MLHEMLQKNKINAFIANAKLSITSFSEITTKGVAKYFESKGENVIYFPLDQTFNFSSEEIEAISLAHRLEKDVDLFSVIDECFDIKIHSWDLEQIKKGKSISGGALRIVNYLATAYTTPEDSIIIINKYDQSLHPMIKFHVVHAIARMTKPKYLIVTSYEDEGYTFDGTQDIRKLNEALLESDPQIFKETCFKMG